MSDLAKLVIKRFPENRGLQLVCLRVVSKFTCSECQEAKKANRLALMAGDWSRLLCEGCYGKLLSPPGS